MTTTGESETSGEAIALHARRYGDRASPKLLILHGLLGFSANWRSVAKQLAGRHEVFCLDLRNHGESPWRDEMNYADLAADVARFIA
ncbi:MAG: alpha/beta fold hydrolase, partial [bacterium]